MANTAWFHLQRLLMSFVEGHVLLVSDCPLSVAGHLQTHSGYYFDISALLRGATVPAIETEPFGDDIFRAFDNRRAGMKSVEIGSAIETHIVPD